MEALGIVPCRGTHGLKHSLDSWGPPEALLVDMRDIQVEDLLDVFGRYARALAATTLILRIGLTRHDIKALLRVIGAGLDPRVAIDGFDDWIEMLQADLKHGDLTRARSAIIATTVRTRPQTDPLLLGLLRGSFPLQPLGGIAGRSGMSVRTLARRCQNAGHLSPHRILARGCCLHAVWLLEFCSWSVKQTAVAAGFTPQAFSHFVKRHSLLPPLELARDVGYERLSARWMS